MPTYKERAELTNHPMAKRLLTLMEEKETNLAIAADVTEQAKLLELAETLGPHICILKTHVDILRDFTPDFGKRLRAIADKHNFLIFEDRKFADIGQTVSLQYREGVYRIADWADIINAHPIAGPGVLDALKGANVLLLAEMSSAGTLAKGAYTKKVVALAEQHPVLGFISLKKLSDQPGLIHMTPGVNLQKGKDSLGQRYRTVDEILIKNRSDVIIVGRAITHATNILEMAQKYRERGWQCYKNR